MFAALFAKGRRGGREVLLQLVIIWEGLVDSHLKQNSCSDQRALNIYQLTHLLRQIYKWIFKKGIFVLSLPVKSFRVFILGLILLPRLEGGFYD